MSGDNEAPTGLAPSADSPTEKRKRVRLGEGAITFICGVAVAAFALYGFIVVYGIYTAQ